MTFRLHLVARDGTSHVASFEGRAAPEVVRWLGTLYLWAWRERNGVQVYREVVPYELGLQADAPARARARRTA